MQLNNVIINSDLDCYLKDIQMKCKRYKDQKLEKSTKIIDSTIKYRT